MVGGMDFVFFFLLSRLAEKRQEAIKASFFRTLVLDKSAAALKRRRENAGSRS